MFGAYVQSLGIAPFARDGVLLVRVFRGRFCFDLGIAAKCFATTIALTAGNERSLDVSLGSDAAGLKVGTRYSFETSIEYSIGDCDSIAPVLYYDDATVLVHQVTRGLGFGLWRRDQTTFVPSTRPVIAGNKIVNDPECGCVAAPTPESNPDDRVSVALDEFLTRLLSTREIDRSGAEVEFVEPEAVVRQALLALEEDLTPTQPDRPERVGFVDLHGHVTWFRGGPTEVEGVMPDMVLVSTDCAGLVQRRLMIPEREARYPVLARSAARFADGGRLQLLIDQGDRRVAYAEYDVTVRADQASAAFGFVDFSDFPHGTSGQLRLELLNREGALTAKPLEENFWVVTQPAVSGSELELVS